MKPKKDKKPKEGRKKEGRKKEEVYVLKKEVGRKTLRIVFWMLLGFFFIKGIGVSLRSDPTLKVQQLIADFQEEQENYKKNSSDASAFAQNFVKEYLTYQVNGEDDFKERIQPYVVDSIQQVQGIWDFHSNTKAIYVNAYRQTECAKNQWDVYVQAEVEYENQLLSPEGDNFDTQITRRKTCLKVPVYIKDGACIVENLPAFVTDDITLKEYPTVYDMGQMELETEQAEEIKWSLVNFLTAYYEQEQSVIDYFLGREADPKQFLSLEGNYTFNSVTELQCYQTQGEEILCQIQFKIRDTGNDALSAQAFSLLIYQEKEKYYINKMENRITNLVQMGGTKREE